MRVLVSWLRDLVPVAVSPQQLAADLQRVGFEVASVEPVDGRSLDDDAVIDFEVTANRPDCLSMLGMAREVATVYDLPVTSPTAGLVAPVRHGRSAQRDALTVEIDDVERCPRYTVGLADVRVGPSPDWLVERLTAVGIRAINNVVDVTNYVMAELGQPLHAFDLERLGGPALRVRLAKPGERVKTLDGQSRALEPDMLVNADANRAQGVAGVMGGGDSEVWSGTRVIALEAAYFQPRTVRRTAKRLGLSTEASYRFERGIDPELAGLANVRALALLSQIGAGTARGDVVDCAPGSRTPRTIDLRASRIAHVLGAPVPEPDVVRILGALGFGVSAGEGATWAVAVPSWRGDVTREVDLVEEVARHHGYDRLPDTFPRMTLAPPPPALRLERDRFVRRVAAGAGFNECVTFSFIERGAAASVADDGEIVALANPLSESFAVLRPSLLPGLLDSLGHNRRRGQRDVRLFELGNCFRTSGGETRSLAMVWTGGAALEHWSGTGRTADFFDMKGVVESVCRALGARVRFVPIERRGLVAGRTAAVVLDGASDATPAGVLGLLDPALASAREMPAQDAVLVAELDVDAMHAAMTWHLPFTTTPLPRFPSIVRDIALVVPSDLPAESIHGTIRRSAPSILVAVREFDRYQGPRIGEGVVSLAIHLTFQAADRTLTDAEVQAAVDTIVRELAAAHGARLR
ncbi:MAG: phenylalanine--tRNA ligase subunit beta [Vicinamibacterales bacterium]